MRRFIQALIFANIAVVAITTVAEYAHDSTQAAAGSLFATALVDLVALSAAYIVVELLVLARFQDDPRWLFVPVIFLVPLAGAAIYMTISSGGPVVPGIARLVFVGGYLAGYFTLRSASPSTERSRGPVAEMS
ncbi:MAG: hypothetical protein ACYDGR_17220 [Candidatus Dormibacteria bacterium]